MVIHASEAGHWYATDGRPVYEVPLAKGGGMRPTTLRDARKLNLVPSVTAIINCAHKPALETWKQNQVLMAALTLPRVEGETSEQLCARIMRDSQEQARKARDFGTLLHAAVQGHYENEPPAEEFWPFVKGTVAAVAEFCGERMWVAEQSFCHPYGYGGKCDLSSEEWVIDFKTKEFDFDADLKTWDEHAMQLAAYREGLDIVRARCAIVYVSTTTPGLARVLEVPGEELKRGWGMFQGLLSYWQEKSGYWPQVEREAA